MRTEKVWSSDGAGGRGAGDRGGQLCARFWVWRGTQRGDGWGGGDFAVELMTNLLHSSRSDTTLLLPALRVAWEQGPHRKPRLLAFPRALGLAVLFTQGLFCPVPCCGRHPSPAGITPGAGRGVAVSEGPAPQRKATVDLAPFLRGPLSSPSPACGTR